MFHTIVLLLLGTFQLEDRLIVLAGFFFASGIVIFSGSLYILAITNIKWLCSIAPIGGFMFLIGWIVLILFSIK